ncbi:MAG: rhomboid family intramembrane serine protease [Halothece sp.]
MVPLHDDQPTNITPYVTYTLIVINVLVFLYQLSLSTPELQAFFQAYAVVPEQFTNSFQSGNEGEIIAESIPLITSQFLHGGFLHLAGNMLFLWVFGGNIEERQGWIKFIIFYLACGALAALAQWLFSMQSEVPALGASGAIAGVMGAYIIRFPKAKILTLVPLGFIITTIRIPAVFFLGFWFVQQAFYGVASLDVQTTEGGGVAYWAHAGGFVFGVILSWLFGLFDSQRR